MGERRDPRTTALFNYLLGAPERQARAAERKEGLDIRREGQQQLEEHRGEIRKLQEENLHQRIVASKRADLALLERISQNMEPSRRKAIEQLILQQLGVSQEELSQPVPGQQAPSFRMKPGESRPLQGGGSMRRIN
jgi:hypothetical protein